MPGIFGVIDATVPPPDQARGDLLRMVGQMAAAMRYESWYEVEYVSSSVLGVYAGRVSHERGTASETRDVRGPLTFTTDEPQVGSNDVTELYERDGANGLASLDRIVSGLILDPRRERWTLFSDHYGAARIFVHFSGPRMFFSSEAKAILAVASETRRFDATGLAQFLACGGTTGPQSLFHGIEVLDGGMILEGSPGRQITRRRYFDRSMLEQRSAHPAPDVQEQLAYSLTRATSNALSIAPRAAMSLTGGLDSRMVMACVEASAGTLPCYTFGSMYRTTSDVSIARQVAARCSQPHQVLELGHSFLSQAREYFHRAVYVSDGYLGLSGAAELYLNARARSIASARITGNWGGELMRGVRAFKFIPPAGGFLQPAVTKQMDDAGNAFTAAGGVHPLSFALFYQMPIQGYGRSTIERSQVVMRSPFLSGEVVRALYQAPEVARQSPGTAAAIIGQRPDLLAIPTDTGQLGMDPALVRSVRRFCRRAVVKAEYLTSHGAPDWLARLSARSPRGLLETLFLGRDKFQHFRVWMRRELAQMTRDVVYEESGSDLQEWFDLRRVTAMVDEHISGRANHTEALDKVMTVALTRRTLLSQGTR